MLITRTKVEEYLRLFLDPEDQIHIALVIDLSWMARIILEYGFQCPRDAVVGAKRKKKFFNLLQRLSDIRKEANVPIDTTEYSYSYEPVFKNEKRLMIEDLAIVCDLFYKIVEEDKKVSRDKLLEWLEEAWDIGVYQQRVYSMEVEGSIMNAAGIVCNFGADLVMFGGSKGLIPPA